MQRPEKRAELQARDADILALWGLGFEVEEIQQKLEPKWRFMGRGVIAQAVKMGRIKGDQACTRKARAQAVINRKWSFARAS